MLLTETKTSICNKALAILGEEPINSMDDTSTKAARVCKQFFDLSLRSVLEEGKWPFATVEEPVQQLDVPAYAKEQKYVYAIPSNAAVIVGLSMRFGRKRMPKGLDWDIRYIEELKRPAIICNKLTKVSDEIELELDQDEQILIEYISDTGDTASYTAAFIRCVCAQLASDICMPITHDSQKWVAITQYAAQMKEKALQQALNEDGQDKVHWVDPITASRGW